MGILALAADERVADVKFTKDTLSVALRDGRTITVPLAWYPRLFNATAAQRKNWRIAGGGYGIHWPDVDEDLSTEGLLRGAPPAPGTGQGSEQHRTPTKTLKPTGPAVLASARHSVLAGQPGRRDATELHQAKPQPCVPIGFQRREESLRLAAIRKARLEPLALSASGHERMVNGWAAASGEE